MKRQFYKVWCYEQCHLEMRCEGQQSAHTGEQVVFHGVNAHGARWHRGFEGMVGGCASQEQRRGGALCKCCAVTSGAKLERGRSWSRRRSNPGVQNLAWGGGSPAACLRGEEPGAVETRGEF